MTLQQIRYCLTIAETGSMNRSAEKLYVTQPALTGAIQELEQEIDGIVMENMSAFMPVRPISPRFPSEK